MGFEEPHHRLMVYFVELELPHISQISAYAAHQGGLVLRYGLERPIIIRIEIIWMCFRMIRLAFFVRDNQEIDRTHEPPISEAIRGSGGIELSYDYEG